MSMLCLAAGVMLSSFAAATAKERAPVVEIFNGKDLSGWVVEGTKTADNGAPVWDVHEGTIQCAGTGFGFLRYDRQFADFTLELEFRLDPGVNSGVGIRHGKYTGNRKSRPSFAGFEIQLQDDADQAPDVHSSGSLYRYVAPQAQAMKPAGQWNKLQIHCRGPHIKIELNGRLIQDVDQRTVDAIAAKPLKGYVSLQNHGGKVAFRNIRITSAD